MLPSYFGYIFVLLRHKVRVRSELSPKFLSTLGPNPNPTGKARPDLQLIHAHKNKTPKLSILYHQQSQQKLRNDRLSS